MTKYTVTPADITLDAYDDERADVLRCVQMLLGTVAGELCMDRDLGVSPDALDMPIPAAKAAISGDIIKQINLYEPRARVQSVSFTASLDGQLIPKVVVDL